MKKCIFLLIVLVILFGCNDPTQDNSDSTSQVLLNDYSSVISKLTMDYQSPVDAQVPSTNRSIDVDDGFGGTVTVANAQEWYEVKVGMSITDLMITLFKNYVGTQSIPAGTVITLAADNSVDNGMGGTFVVGASQIRIEVVGSSVFIYWNAEIQASTMPDGTPVMADGLMQIQIEGGTPGIWTDYTKITCWTELPDDNAASPFRHKSYVDLSSGIYSRVEFPAGAGATIPFSGTNEYCGPGSDGGRYFYQYYRNLNDSVGGIYIFGDSNRIISYFKTSADINDLGYTLDTYIVGDTADPDGSGLVASDKSFLDDGYIDNPTPTWATISGNGTDYDRVFGPSGTFDTEFTAASKF